MKMILFAIAVFAGLVAVTDARPKLPDASRWIEFDIPNTGLVLIRDTRTGCEYIRANSYDSAPEFVRGSCNAK